jgi:hypothetical protein
MRHQSVPAVQIARARLLARTLGMRCAAGYLRNQDFTLDQALGILLGTCERDPCAMLRVRGLL